MLSVLSARGGIPQSDLAAALGLDQTTLSRNVKVLIGRKWVESSVSAKDQRRACYMLSPEGQRVWQAALPHWRRAQGNMQEIMGREWQSVWAALERLTSAAAR